MADGHRQRACFGAAVFGLLLTLTVTQSMAQSRERGWWGGDRYGAARDAEFRRQGEREAAHLYADARREIERGNVGLGQHQLELLVATYPESPLAPVARGDLKALYALADGEARRPRTSLDDRRSVIEALPSMSVPSPSPSQNPGLIDVKPVASSRTTSVDSAVTSKSFQPSTAQALRQASEDFREQAGDRIFFAEGSADLGTRAQAALRAQAIWLQQNPSVQIVLEGHADDRGSDQLNRQLAESRAAAARTRLEDLGIAAYRISTVAVGRDQPVARCADPNCASQNRRVVAVIAAEAGHGTQLSQRSLPQPGSPAVRP